VHSNQAGPHPGLQRLVRRHLEAPYAPPVAEHNRVAAAQLFERLRERPRPLVLDSFCGTGHSTALLAARHPQHLVVGIDKSAQRLARHRPLVRDNSCASSHYNYLLLRADCEAIWRALADRGVRADHHYVLYPNPWPKSTQLKRRVHGHPAFASLLALGGRLELRSNWRTYVEEFAIAMQLAGRRGRVRPLADSGAPISLFEKKYRASGHALWSYTAAP